MRKTIKKVLTHIREVGGFHINSLDCWRLNRKHVGELTRPDQFCYRTLSKNSINLSSSRCFKDYDPMCIYFLTCYITQMTPGVMQISIIIPPVRYRSTLELKCRSLLAHKCRSTKKSWCRSMLRISLCGSCVPYVLGLRTKVIPPCYFWY